MMNEDTWEVAVLKTLVDLVSGNIELQDIYYKLRHSGYVEITPELEVIKYGTQPYYYDYVRSIIKKLKDKNQVEHVSKGVYSITAEGLEKLKKIAGIEEV